MIEEYPGTSILVIYIAGYFLSVMALGTWGKKWGMDYESYERDWDDWEDNASAYAGISFAWPLLLIVGTLALIMRGCKRFAQGVINLNKRK